MKNKIHQPTTEHNQEKTHHKEHHKMRHHHPEHNEHHEMKHEHHRRRRHSQGEAHDINAEHHEHRSRRHGRAEGKMHLKRLFERGDLQLLILVQLQKSASHGYELIKSINELSHGVYEPSPGVIYPTLAMLEDQGLISQDATQKSKKSYLITEEGLLHLTQHEERLLTLKERLAGAKNQGNINFSQEIDQAIRNFKMLLRHQLRHEQLSSDQVTKIVTIINQATQEISQVNQTITEASVIRTSK